MYVLFLLKSFFIGVAAVCGLGPIFLLTLNRSAKRGFLHGVVTASGAAVGDGFLFLLGLLGVLQVLEGSSQLIIVMDLVGGCLVIMLGVKMLEYKMPKTSQQQDRLPLAFCWIKPFFLTILNPAALIFFMMVSVQIIPKSGLSIPFYLVAFSSAMVALGSVIALSGVAYMASTVGARVNQKYIENISYVSGAFLIVLGIYFLSDSVILLLQSL